MSLLDVVFEPTVETQIVSVKQVFKDDTTFDGATNSFSQYPKIDLATYAEPANQYEFTPKRYVTENFQTKSSYLDGISSSVQNQLDAKLGTSTASSTYQTILTNASFLDATSSVQDQLDAKLNVSTASTTYQPLLTNPQFYDPSSSIQTQLNSKTTESYVNSSISGLSSVYQTIIPNASYLDMTSSVQTQLNSKTTETYVNTQINNLINSAPSTLDTLGEIATILSGNVNDIGTLTTSIAGKISKTANETISGILTFSQPIVTSGASITSGSIPDSALASTFLKTSDASSTYQTQSATTSALALKANLNSPSFSGTVSGISKSMVGLSNVDNVSDTNKPVSTAQQTAINNNLPIVIENSTTGLISGSSITAPERAYLITNYGAPYLTATVNSVTTSLEMGESIRVTSLTSPTVLLDGIANNWTARNTPFGSNTINAVAYGNVGGTNYYVAVGAAGNLATSTDSITWTSRTSNFGSNAINNIAYGTIGGTGYFVAVGASGTLATSTDAITWTTQTSGFGSTAINAIGYGNNTFIAVGASGVLTTSTDAITWTTRTSGFSTTAINAIGYGTVGGTNYFVAVGASGVMTTATTADLATWTSRTSGFGTSNINGITFGNGIFVATGAGSLSAGGLISTSTDAINWTNRVHPTGSGGVWVSYGVIGSTNVFIINSSNTNSVSYSNDGITWSQRSAPMIPQQLTTTKTGYCNGIFLLVGNTGLMLASSNQVRCLVTPVTYQAL